MDARAGAELQIVSDDVVGTAQHGSRSAQREHAGAPAAVDIARRWYLLSGFARCAHVRRRVRVAQPPARRAPRATSTPARALEARARGRAPTAWSPGWTLIDAEVLATLQDDIFRPSIIEQAVALAIEALSPATSGHRAREAGARTARRARGM